MIPCCILQNNRFLPSTRETRCQSHVEAVLPAAFPWTHCVVFVEPSNRGPLLHSNYYFTGRFLPKDRSWKQLALLKPAGKTLSKNIYEIMNIYSIHKRCTYSFSTQMYTAMQLYTVTQVTQAFEDFATEKKI